MVDLDQRKHLPRIAADMLVEAPAPLLGTIIAHAAEQG